MTRSHSSPFCDAVFFQSATHSFPIYNTLLPISQRTLPCLPNSPTPLAPDAIYLQKSFISRENSLVRYKTPKHFSRRANGDAPIAMGNLRDSDSMFLPAQSRHKHVGFNQGNAFSRYDFLKSISKHFYILRFCASNSSDVVQLDFLNHC